jgi:hypothetical protein
MCFACWITKATDTLRICNIYCFCTAAVVTRMRFSVMLYVHCMSCLVLWLFGTPIQSPLPCSTCYLHHLSMSSVVWTESWYKVREEEPFLRRYWLLCLSWNVPSFVEPGASKEPLKSFKRASKELQKSLEKDSKESQKSFKRASRKSYKRASKELRNKLESVSKELQEPEKSLKRASKES